MKMDIIESFARVAQFLDITSEYQDAAKGEGGDSGSYRVDVNNIGKALGTCPWFLYGMNNP